MASQILSGSQNPSYTNNTGQNVRLVINHMAEVTQINWAGNNITLPTIETRHVASPTDSFNESVRKYYDIDPVIQFPTPTKGYTINSSVKTINLINESGLLEGLGLENVRNIAAGSNSDSVIYYVTTDPAFYGTYKREICIPSKIFLAPTETFSAICRSYNIVVIKEDGN